MQLESNCMEKPGMISLAVLVKCLVECSEKAARIAQICRSEKELFKLLIEEKTEAEKNQRFVHDFKTLADVLVQETIRWQIGKQFPAISSAVRGEESNHFQNSLGQSIDVCLCDTVGEAISLLSKVLDGNLHAAELLAKCAYEDISVSVKTDSNLEGCFLPFEHVGIWIDPIDSTSEYINGKFENSKDCALVESGLQCVCTLIGAYDRYSGKPLVGVINQPFFMQHSDRWESKFYWGVCCSGLKQSSLLNINSEKTKIRIVTSSALDITLLTIMQSEYDVTVLAGAGYKCLVVAREDADLYVLSQGTTFLWDTCGPHALLCASGGGIVDFRNALSAKCFDYHSDIESLHIKYNIPDSDSSSKIDLYCNKNGIIAYRDKVELFHFIQFIQRSGYNPQI